MAEKSQQHGGHQQSEGDITQEDMALVCDELEMLLARAKAVHAKMQTRQLSTMRAKKVAARERGWDGYTSFLDGVEKAVLYPATPRDKPLPEPARIGRKKS